MNAVTTYDAARVALHEAKTVDDAKDIADKAEALRIYAHQRGDLEMETWVAEIKLRASVRIGELSKGLEKGAGRPRDEICPSSGKNFKRDALAKAGISPSAAHRCERLASIPPAKFERYIAEMKERGKPVSATELYRIVPKREKVTANRARIDGCTVSNLEALVSSSQKFGTIYADPPWLYDNQGTRASTGNHYGGMTVEELCALPIKDIAADDAHLHLWTTNGFLFECPRIFEAWGFEFRSSFVWVKPQIGIGNYWRNSHEFLLTAIRGDAKRFNDKSLRSWMECDRGRHSAKPEQVRRFIERASTGPYLELFGRQSSDNWVVWGDQIERNIFNAALMEVA